jgi:hypothetical protein
MIGKTKGVALASMVLLIVLGTLVAGLERARACVHDSFTHVALVRAEGPVSPDPAPTRDVQAAEELRQRYAGLYSHPLAATHRFRDVRLRLEHEQEIEFPARVWVEMGAVTLIALLLILGAWQLGHRLNKRRWLRFEGHFDFDLPHCVARSNGVGIGVLFGLVLGLTVLLLHFELSDGREMLGLVAPYPISHVPAPHHFPVEPSNAWMRHHEGEPRESHTGDRRKPTRAVTLRFSMVHDVLHERYVRPGPAYYRARSLKAVERIESIQREYAGHGGKVVRSSAWRDAVDDLAMGLERLGRLDTAQQLLERKLVRQQRDQHDDRSLYTVRANLATVLAHKYAGKALRGDQNARSRLRDALELIKDALATSDTTHFGREVWQKIAIEYILMAGEEPELLTQYDLVGNWLNPHRSVAALQRWSPPIEYFGHDVEQESLAVLQANGRGVGEHTSARSIRDLVRRVGAEHRWHERYESTIRHQVPFDEPVLGIIGMWRLGGGPNPHFALTLGGIMERVGRERLAWVAYERAVRMKDAWPVSVRAELVDYCRARQQKLSGVLGVPRADLLTDFEAERARGSAYRDLFHAYERAALEDGRDVDGAFHAEFFEDVQSIATPPSRDERIAINGWIRPDWRAALTVLPWVLLLGAIGAWIGLFASYPPTPWSDGE